MEYLLIMNYGVITFWRFNSIVKQHYSIVIFPWITWCRHAAKNSLSFVFLYLPQSVTIFQQISHSLTSKSRKISKRSIYFADIVETLVNLLQLQSFLCNSSLVVLRLTLCQRGQAILTQEILVDQLPNLYFWRKPKWLVWVSSSSFENVKLIVLVFLKPDYHPSKKLSYLLQWKPFKNREKWFLFYLKTSFRSQDI